VCSNLSNGFPRRSIGLHDQGFVDILDFQDRHVLVRGQLLELESELIKVSANSIRLPAGFGDRLSLIGRDGNGFLYQSGP